jgi:ABC-type dipeptide/oligopeptide/nickel transport system permease subunit
MSAQPEASPTGRDLIARGSQGLRVLLSSRTAVILLLLIVAYCVFWPMVAPHGADEVDLPASGQGPSWDHPLGTDSLGRDLLSRLAVGGRNSLLIAAMALVIILVIGVAYGTAAAMAGGKIDEAMMRVVDGLFAIPRLLVAIVILVALKVRAQNIETVAFALSIVGWMVTARLVRGRVLSLVARDFVTAARAFGAGTIHIALRHLIRNSMGIVFVAVLLELPTVVIGEAFLAVFGIGPEPPIATWGNIAKDGLDSQRPWPMFVAAVIISAFALSANILVDRLQQFFDPRRRNV